MAGAALVTKVRATTPAATQKLARRPSTNGARLRGMQELGRWGSRAAGDRRAPLVIEFVPGDLLDEEEGGADIDGEEPVESFDGRVLERCCLRAPAHS